jgi:enoyl-CoA hydratase/carnithine racemase
MEFSTLQFERVGNIATITLNRPEVLNAINRQMMSELNQVLDSLAHDNEIRAAILKGEGRAFCAGFDIKEEAVDTVAGTNEWFPRYQRDWETFLKVWRLDIPVIAAVQGYCLGGAFELMMLCDACIAAENAVFGYPERRQASGPGMGLLVFNIGSLKRAKELMMLGDMFDAAIADRLGLINRVVAPDLLESAALDLAQRFVLIPQAGIQISKQFINGIVQRFGLDDTIRHGAALATVLTASREYQEMEELRKEMGPERMSEFFKMRDQEFEASS